MMKSELSVLLLLLAIIVSLESKPHSNVWQAYKSPGNQIWTDCSKGDLCNNSADDMSS